MYAIKSCNERYLKPMEAHSIQRCELNTEQQFIWRTFDELMGDALIDYYMANPLEDGCWRGPPVVLLPRPPPWTTDHQPRIKQNQTNSQKVSMGTVFGSTDQPNHFPYPVFWRHPCETTNLVNEVLTFFLWAKRIENFHSGNIPYWSTKKFIILAWQQVKKNSKETQWLHTDNPIY